MPYSRFACVVFAVALTIAIIVDVTSLLLARKLGGFGFAARPWQWVFILGVWWGASILIASYLSEKTRIRPF
jgi:hypothetical protein